jgi:primosomal protein N' (replication factor Y)
MPLLADVAVPVPLSRAFTYEVPAELADKLRAGARVTCPFGSRRVVGVVLAVSERSAPDVRLRALGSIVDAEPVVPAELLSFVQELSTYYLAPIGEVLRLALPAMERGRAQELASQGELALNQTRVVGKRRLVFARPTDAVEKPGTLRGQAAAVLALLRSSGNAPVTHLEERFGNARAAVKKLEALGLVTTELREPPPDAFFAESVARDEAPDLTDAQRTATLAIEAGLDAPPASFLLFGVTGSGKTEVYLRAIAAVLARGRGALVLVPEIALTPQLVGRFRARFGDEVAVLHSGLADLDRHAMWRSLREGRVRVAIGARSAIFAPVPDLGLVIVDEEHDSSFKQEEGVRYNARDMALLRAHRAKAVAVLGSATPSLETVALARRGRLVELILPDRARREATLPLVTIVDRKNVGAGPSGNPLISLPLHRALEATLAAKEQSILFLNRRGFAPSVVCDGCGEVEMCRACSVALTFHRLRGSSPTSALQGRLRCHYCDWAGPLPERCSSCKVGSLELEGLGTERLEDTIAAAFPDARVARLDRDVAAGPKSEAILQRMRSGEIDILVGTQMVTKGHDLPNVTLVGVVNADAALSMPDFRASERGFQLLVQVSGRAGRHDRKGRVLIQTRSPQHPAIRFAAHHDVQGFLRHELEDRREVGYPPFAHLALLRVDAVSEDVARGAAALFAAHARTSPEAKARLVDVLGPAPAPIARVRGRYRFRVLLRAEQRGPLRKALAAASAAYDAMDHRARAIVDIDPMAML